MPRIILTGGGTAGHVNGNIALLEGLRKRGYEITYIGSRLNIERELIPKENIPYHIISSGMLRRYFDLKNFTDIFRVLKGVVDAMKVIDKDKPDVIFSKGGFVTVPVAIAAKLKNIPFICHESDLSPGLANRIAGKFADRMLVTFPETLDKLGREGTLVGSPIRPELLRGDKEKGLKFLGFDDDKPLLLAMGGSLGSPLLNKAIQDNLELLTKKFNICHHVGQDFYDKNYDNIPGYRQFTYIREEMKDVMKATSFVISRAGSNSIFEFLSLKIPNILIPLGFETSRGDQIENAESFKNMGYSLVLEEKEVNGENLLNKIEELLERKEEFIKKMSEAKISDGVESILNIIDDTVKVNINKER